MYTGNWDLKGYTIRILRSDPKHRETLSNKDIEGDIDISLVTKYTEHDVHGGLVVSACI